VSDSRRLGGARGQLVKPVRRDEDFEWITVDGVPMKRRRARRKPAPARAFEPAPRIVSRGVGNPTAEYDRTTMPPTKNSPKQETAPFGTVPRPKYETGPTDEPVNDSHSRDSNAESPYLKDFIPGSARG
jgi:hypothetical protein